MNAYKIAAMAPFIREVLADAAVLPEGKEPLCATFEVASVDAWVQITPTELNVGYPLDQSPDDVLAEIGRYLPEAELIIWEPGKFATWTFVSTNPYEIAEAVDFVLSRVHKLTEYAIDGKLERL